MSSEMMIQYRYVKRYLLPMAMDQLIDEYIQKGFEIKPQYPILDNFRADIYAIKDDEKVAIEFVHISDSEESMQNLKQLAAEEGITLRFIDISKIQIQLKDNDTVKTN